MVLFGVNSTGKSLFCIKFVSAMKLSLTVTLTYIDKVLRQFQHEHNIIVAVVVLLFHCFQAVSA